MRAVALSKGNQTFKETDVKRALRAARKELSGDFTLRITRDAICIETRATEPTTKVINADEWRVE
jgi:hypothetical protein